MLNGKSSNGDCNSTSTERLGKRGRLFAMSESVRHPSPSSRPPHLRGESNPFKRKQRGRVGVERCACECAEENVGGRAQRLHSQNVHNFEWLRASLPSRTSTVLLKNQQQRALFKGSNGVRCTRQFIEDVEDLVQFQVGAYFFGSDSDTV
ncbi:hypothetical protein BLNAU_5863 [Blattamonas nauphoetae]|uniref:Uncharacterized protein n=1 Tax=Blattamonas nauphoetae TaxID=2049346 RepID=A0ABQ9Y5P2_9EUKA|nr:hypothetical protein BLNAU_5863 [Blattamonas nauphoetae]